MRGMRPEGSAHPGHQVLQAPQHLLQAALGDHFHHLLRLLELAEQLVHLLDRHAGAGRDAPLARGLEELGLGALLRASSS